MGAYQVSTAIGKKIKRTDNAQELCKNMKIEITVSDLTEKKVISTDSVVVKLQKL